MIKRPMLAGKVDFSKLTYPVLCTPKLDGIRALKLGEKLVSRNFKSIPNKDVQRRFRELPEGCDGELIVPDRGFNVTSSEVMSKYGEFGGKYYVFDFIPADLKTPYVKRVLTLEQLGSPDRVILVLPVLIKNEAELCTFEEDMLGEGYEGIMIRSPEGPYKEGRSTAREGFLLKLKRFEDGEAIVVEFEQRMSNKNEQVRDAFGLAKRSSHQAGLQPMDMLGALVVKDIDTGTTFSLGSGFDEDQRKMIWSAPEDYRGKIVKYKWQACGSVDKPRFPIFLGFRS